MKIQTTKYFWSSSRVIRLSWKKGAGYNMNGDPSTNGNIIILSTLFGTLGTTGTHLLTNAMRGIYNKYKNRIKLYLS